MAILKTWSRRSEKRLDALEITAEKVYIACYEGDDCSAVGCSRTEFRDGKLNRVAEDVFGEAVLAEALAWLRAH